MFKEFFRYDLISRLKQPMVYIFFALSFILFFADSLSDNFTIGGPGGDYFINAPYAIASKVTFMCLLGAFMTVAFTNAAALRDFDSKYDQILFATPIKKKAYVFGRFLSSIILALIPFIGVLLGIFIGSLFADPGNVGPFSLAAYTTAFFFIALPNVLLTAAILFPLAIKTRSHAVGFAGAIFLFISYLISSNMLGNLENEWLVFLSDPFGLSILRLETKYWTVEDLNNLAIPISTKFILNRVLWLVVSVLLLWVAYRLFSFVPKNKELKANSESTTSPKMSTAILQKYKALPISNQTLNFGAQLKQLWIQYRLEFNILLGSTAFLLMALFGSLNTIASAFFADKMFGSGNLPVSYIMTDVIKSSAYVFVVIVIGFFSGQLVWAERKAKMNELLDATPQVSWVPLLSKFFVLSTAVLSLMLVNIFSVMIIQLVKGYFNVEPMVYFVEIIALDLPYFMLVIALALLIHVLINRQYIGFFVFLVLLLLHLFVWPSFEIDSNLFTFGGRPEHTYSDMSRWMPHANGLFAYTLYWSLIGGLLLIVGSLFWVRGYADKLKNRLATASLRFHGRPAMMSLLVFLCWGGIASTLFYKSDVLNENLSRDEQKQKRALYEQTYKKYQDLPQARIVAADYQVDFYPEKRGMEAQVKLWLKNKGQQAINEVHFTLPDIFQIQIEVPQAKNTLMDEELFYQIYQLDKALEAGDSIQVTVKASYQAQGIENELLLPNLTQNGIFLNNNHFMPTIGYSPNYEMTDNEEREEYGLEAHEGMAKLAPECSSACNNHFISTDADWVSLKSVVSTSADQTAIAPGILQQSWEKDNRKYFEYALEKKTINFFAFLSAAYELKKEAWNGIELEVYHHPSHDHNVDKMMASMKASLAYYSEHFSPYPHGYARIVEFPRFARFAQAFPGTMPYSESAGFIADLKDPKDIDFVTYVVAHEMAHQWWAHQLIGADVQGVQMLSETFAQYGALMVMEKTYGKEVMHKFLKHEMDDYLRSRSALEEEPPLMRVEFENTIFYNKGSVVMYALREYLGEETINTALRNFMEKYGYTEPPYPTSLDFLSELEALTPDSLRYFTDDFFREVTLYDNAIEEATYTQLDNGKYEIKLLIQSKKLYATGKGQETEQALADYIEVAIFGEVGENEPQGKKLYSEFLKFEKNKNQLTIIVEEEPQRAAIDPRYLLPDRFPEDNNKSVEKN